MELGLHKWAPLGKGRRILPVERMTARSEDGEEAEFMEAGPSDC